MSVCVREREIVKGTHCLGMLSIPQVMCPQECGCIGDIICKTPVHTICTVRRSRDHQTIKGMQIKIYTGKANKKMSQTL